MGNAGHAHVAVAPWLRGRPFNRLVEVLNGLRVNVSEDTAGLVCACNVYDEKGVTTANVKMQVSGFNEASRSGESDGGYLHRLHRLRIGVNGQECREFALGSRPKNVRVECHSISDRNGDIAFDPNPVFSRRSLPPCRKHSYPPTMRPCPS